MDRSTHTQWLDARDKQTELLRLILIEGGSGTDAFDEAKDNLKAALTRLRRAARQL